MDAFEYRDTARGAGAFLSIIVGFITVFAIIGIDIYGSFGSFGGYFANATYMLILACVFGLPWILSGYYAGAE